MIPPEIRAAIRDLQEDYVACIDDDRLEEWPGFFTDDALYEIIPRENEAAGLPAPLLRCEGAAMMRDRVASLRHANIYEQPLYRHLLSGVRVTAALADGWTVRTGYAVLNTSVEGETTIYQSGVYEDRVVRTATGLAFHAKRVIYDTSRVATLLAYPI